MQNKFRKKKFNKENTKNLNLISIVQDRRFQIITGVIILGISLFLFLSLLSHIFYGSADQLFIESIDKQNFSIIKKKIVNKLGLLGAFSSYYLYYRWFGIASFFVALSIFTYGYKFIFNKDIKLFKINVLLWFLVLWLNLTLAYIDSFFLNSSNFEFLLGGIGIELYSELKNFIGQGILIVILLSIIIFFIYVFNIKYIKGVNFKIFTKTYGFLKVLINKFFGKSNNDSLIDDNKIMDDDVESNIDDSNKNSQFEFDINSGSSKDDKKPNVSFTIENFNTENSKVKNATKESSVTVTENNVDETGKLHTNFDPSLELASYKFPISELLKEHDFGEKKVSTYELEQNKDKILETLTNFKIGISSIKATIGPTVTLYEIIPEAGIKISKIKNLEDDIALNLAALGIRIIAPIPGKGTIGIEVPNKQREIVPFKSIIESEKFKRAKMNLPVILGKTISNEVYISDLASMPHLLIAGATGQGKSVGLNVILASLLYKKHPSQLKLVLVDPKKVELSLFSKIERHFLAKIPSSEESIITATKEVVYTLNSLCIEMDTRYELLKDAGVRNIKEYNAKFIKRTLNPQQGHRFLPYIVLVIDEFADMIMTAGKEIETPIARLAQLARAIGIHLVLATQRPSVNVITGTIKANFPARISYKVSSKIDSRTILDSGGADQLVGKGDLLLSINSDIVRLQCPYLDTEEIDEICEYIGSQKGYFSAYELPVYEADTEKNEIKHLDERDSMFEEAARLIVSHQQGSTSLIQRRLKLGYNRAGRLIDQLEAAGVVGPFEGSKARGVLIPDAHSLELLLKNLDEKKIDES